MMARPRPALVEGDASMRLAHIADLSPSGASLEPAKVLIVQAQELTLPISLEGPKKTRREHVF